MAVDPFDTPIFVTVRDRVTDLRLLVEWLENAGYQRPILVDNHSSYPPLLEYLEASPHQVIRLPSNFGSRALWHARLVPSEPFVLTDPDIVPTEDTPADCVAHLHGLLQRFWLPKVGLGLVHDEPAPMMDVPQELLQGMTIREWETELVHPRRALAKNCFDSLIDTTFALYRANSEWDFHAIRCGPPWQARHLPWYRTELDEEHAYYLQHAEVGPEGTTWTP